MNLLLLRSGYPIVIISNERRNDYINAIAYGQSKGEPFYEEMINFLEQDK